MAPTPVFREDLPLGPFDHNPVMHVAVSYIMLQFPKRLDHVKVRSSLEQVIRKEGWHMLGARLYRNWRGTVRMRIPAEFNNEMPPLQFTRNDTGVKLRDHPLYNVLPQALSSEQVGPHVTGDLRACEDLILPEDRPKRIGYYIGTGRPALGVHFLEFLDATFLTFHYPHAMMDAMGVGDFLTSWNLVLQGEHPSHPCYMLTNPIQGLGRGDGHKLLVDSPQLSFPAFAYGFLKSAIRDTLARSPKRSLWLPRSFVEQQRAVALKELQESSKDTERAVLSDNDVVCAWWSKTLATCLELTARNSVAVHIVHSQKAALSKELFDGGVYVHNAVGLIPAVIPAVEVLKRPVSHTAHKIRESVTRLKTAPQIHAYAALQRRSPLTTFPVFGDKKPAIFLFTNLTRTRMANFDARNIGLGATEDDEPCTPALFLGGAIAQLVFPGFFVITQDFKGNYLITGTLRNSVWNKVATHIGQL